VPASQRQLPRCHLRGIELRSVLTMHLAVHGRATVAELTGALNHNGFRVRGRPSKAVSDALRWEIDHGRVRRLGRGRYGPAYIPRSIEYRIHQRVLALRSAVVAERRAFLLTQRVPLSRRYSSGGWDQAYRRAMSSKRFGVRGVQPAEMERRFTSAWTLLSTGNERELDQEQTPARYYLFQRKSP
jgi:hypothetical protein